MLINQIKSRSLEKVIGLLLLVGGLLVLSLYLTDSFSNLEKKEILISAQLTDKPGFDLNTTSLIFGNLVPENGASREITIENIFTEDIRVIINARGEISNYLSVSENDFVLYKGEKKKISFTLFFPKDSELKKYNGKITILLKQV